MFEYVAYALMFANLALLVAVVSRLSVMWREVRTSSKEHNQTQSRPTSRTLKPFAKPSGKRQPKINDDTQAWRKENELDLPR